MDWVLNRPGTRFCETPHKARIGSKTPLSRGFSRLIFGLRLDRRPAWAYPATHVGA